MDISSRILVIVIKFMKTTTQATTYSASINTGAAALLILTYFLGAETANKLVPAMG